MNDAISRSAVLDAISQSTVIPCHEVVQAICDLSALDVAPVVHARWRWRNGHYECTACGGNRFHDLALGCDASYCPRCGARMDGEADA